MAFPLGATKEKFPSTSVTVPVLVPSILIDAPITGSPSSWETTLPVTVVWARAIPVERISPPHEHGQSFYHNSLS